MEFQSSYLNSGHRRIIFGKIVEDIELQSEIGLQSPKLKIEDSQKSFLRIFSLRPRGIELQSRRLNFNLMN